MSSSIPARTMSFDDRSVSRAMKQDWGHGRGSLRMSIESSIVVRDPLLLDCVVITLGLQDLARRVIPARLSPLDQHLYRHLQQQLQPVPQPQYYNDELTPPLKQRWIDHIKEFTVPERTFSWPQLVARLRSFPRIPPSILGFFLQFMNHEIADASRKAMFLEHRTMSVSLEISVITDMPSEFPVMGHQFSTALGKEAVCDQDEHNKDKSGESLYGCGGSNSFISGPGDNNEKEEEIANICKLSL